MSPQSSNLAVSLRTSALSPIARLRAGDRVLLGTLYARHAKTLRQLAGNLLGNESNADDAVQDAFVRLLANDPRLPPAPPDPFDWLRAIVRGVCADMRDEARSQCRLRDAGRALRRRLKTASLHSQ